MPNEWIKTSVLVKRVEERVERVYEHGFGDSAVFSSGSLGWFVVFREGFSIGVGHDKPDFLGGERVILTLQGTRYDEPR